MLWKRILKQVFGQDKELQEEVILPSNAFRNKLDDFVISSNKKDIISGRQTKNATNPQLSGTGRNKVDGHFEIE